MSVLQSSHSDNANENKPRVRKIRFVENHEVSSSLAPMDIIESREQMSDLWYNSCELRVFRAEVRTLCRELRARRRNNTDDDGVIVSTRFHSPTRELEQRGSLERQRRRILSAKFVVRQQRRLSVDGLAAAARKINAWAAELAVREAVSDEDDDDAPELRPVKRSLEEEDRHELFSSERRVRRRLSVRDGTARVLECAHPLMVPRP